MIEPRKCFQELKKDPREKAALEPKKEFLGNKSRCLESGTVGFIEIDRKIYPGERGGVEVRYMQ